MTLAALGFGQACGVLHGQCYLPNFAAFQSERTFLCPSEGPDWSASEYYGVWWLYQVVLSHLGSTSCEYT